MMYDAVLEVSYRNNEGLTKISNVYSDLKISLWCNYAIDIIIVDTDNINQKNEVLQNVDQLIGENVILAPTNETSPLILRSCQCPTTPVTVLLPEFDSFHVSPIKYEGNKEYLHVMLSSTNTEGLMDKIKNLENVEGVHFKYLTPFKFPEKPFPVYLPINELLKSLTDKQYEALIESYNKGYYELPRQTSTEDIAKKFNVNRRTLEDHLRKAERNIFNMVIPYFLMIQKENLT